jgi:hypothetical protein
MKLPQNIYEMLMRKKCPYGLWALAKQKEKVTREKVV